MVVDIKPRDGIASIEMTNLLDLSHAITAAATELTSETQQHECYIFNVPLCCFTKRHLPLQRRVLLGGVSVMLLVIELRCYLSRVTDFLVSGDRAVRYSTHFGSFYLLSDKWSRSAPLISTTEATL